MKTISLWIGRLSTTTIRLLSITFFIAALIFSYNYGLEIYTEKEDFDYYIKLIAASIVFVGIFSSFLSRFIPVKVFVGLLILIAFVPRLIWILNINTPIESDFSLLYNAAISATNGDYSFSETPYFSAWVYQIGFTMYQALIISIFGENVFVLKILNILFSVGITVLLYLIGRKLFNEAAGRAASLFYAMYIPSVVMCSVLTNDHLSTFFYFLGFFLLVKARGQTWKVGLLIGLFLAMGNIIRPIGSLILIAVFLYYVVYEIILTNKEKRIPSTKSLAAIFAAYFIVMNVASYGFIAAGVTEHPLSNRAPYWKFLLGFNHESKGRYSNDDAVFMGPYPLGEERDQVEKALVKERLADKKKVAQLFYDKSEIMWGERDSSVVWSMSKIYRVDLMDNIRTFDHAVYIVMLFFSALSVLFHGSKSKTAVLFFMILVLGYFSVHLLIEIQTRYRFFIIPTFALLAGGGLSYLLGRIRFGKKTAAE
jgi:4-amino-4-deoxy-L-arabinose transferase-like glycosyltransferase